MNTSEPWGHEIMSFFSESLKMVCLVRPVITRSLAKYDGGFLEINLECYDIFKQTFRAQNQINQSQQKTTKMSEEFCEMTKLQSGFLFSF